MCGENAFDILRLVCTMWDEVDSGNRTQVTDKVKNRFSKVLGEGVRYEEFKNTPASAWAIVEGFGDEKKVLLDQRRMVDGRTDLQKTSRLKLICSRWNTIFTGSRSQTIRHS
ncbi:hypothetical protein EDD16DRAFT_1559109 [Pisolithus croceorrhizus]|nr:hypothetical protein EDD16DRAFT_1559109 [Pisolithus croceorrhizus]KAI6144513.1 hypothetical protein EDD17DRAFT_170384 [Pisolithus thermaeus]